MKKFSDNMDAQELNEILNDGQPDSVIENLKFSKKLDSVIRDSKGDKE